MHHCCKFLLLISVYTLINCGSPKDVFGASKSYNSTTYKSEVIYTCKNGEKLKSICEKDNKWTWVEPKCKGKINRSSLVASL